MLGQRGVRARRHLGQQRRLLGRADPGRLAGTGTGRHLAQVPALPPAQQRRPVDAEEGGDLAHRAAGVELPQGTFAEVAGVLLHPRSVAQDATCPQSALAHDYLDTGVAIAAIFPATLHAAGAQDFCRRLIQQASTVYFSQILRLEFTEAVRKLATIPGRMPDDIRRRFRLDDWERDVSHRNSSWSATSEGSQMRMTMHDKIG